MIGSVTDPYLPEEAKYRRTRAFLEEIQGSGALINIATKSDLVLEDLELIKTFPDARVSWSINTLDEVYRADMDRGSSIERRLEAMRIFHSEGIRTTCFISPIFPGITNAFEIIERVKHQCNLIWLENLNLRGGFKGDILEYIRTKWPNLVPLYQEIYQKRDLTYWQLLDQQLEQYAEAEDLEYLINAEPTTAFEDPPILVNFFYHEKIKQTPSRR